MTQKLEKNLNKSGMETCQRDIGRLSCIRQPKNAEKAHVTFRIATNKYS